MYWDWKETVSNWNREKIINDLLKEDYVDSVIFMMAKPEVYGIINSCNYKFVIADGNFDDVYPLAVNMLKKHIIKFLDGKKSSLSTRIDNGEFLKKIVSKIANNIRNLYDIRYRDSIAHNRGKTKMYGDYLEDTYANTIDPLTILITEEDEAELNALISEMDREYIEFIENNTKLGDDNQLELDFNDE
jgi:hypothetical protein